MVKEEEERTLRMRIHVYVCLRYEGKEAGPNHIDFD